jgi:hypothetical protein
MSEEIHDPELRQLETALAGLAPRPAEVDRDRLMFAAGRLSAARTRWVLPLASASLASAATLLAVLILYRPPTRFVYVPAPQVPLSAPSSGSPVPESQPPASADYILLRNRLLNEGVEALPSLPPDPSPAGTPDRMMRPYSIPADDF